MKIAYSTVCINPSFPIKATGFAVQFHPMFTFKDDLHARILAFEDEEKYVFHISNDSLGFVVAVQESLQLTLSRMFDKPVYVTISSTHTHFGGDTRDIRYQGEFLSRVVYAIQYLEFKELEDPTISYQCVPFEGVGTSRISHHKANVLLQLFTIYEKGQPLVAMIVHNCHPTVHTGSTPYFTAEYPGFTLQEMKRRYPDVFFTFMQGAAGDVSTRFTRPSQDYAGMSTLALRLADKVEELLKEDCHQSKLDAITYDATTLALKHEFTEVDLSNIPADLTPRELETIEQGRVARENLAKRPATLTPYVVISKLDLGPNTIVFCPNEAFSSYIDCVDIKRSALAGYSNGYSPYLTGTNDNFITYEKFTDTVTVECKEAYKEILRKYGK